MTTAFLLQLLLQVWLPIALLVAAGGLWVRFRPQFPPDPLRINLNRLVVDVFAPPLLFALSAQAQISAELLTVPMLLIASIGIGFALLYPLLFHSPLGRGLARETRAAILLAGCFGNVLFMGYPTLTFLYGDLGGSYAAFADVLASTPVLWVFGVWIATRLGHEGGHGQSLLRTVLTLPPIWGFVLGFAVNLAGIDVAPLIKAAKFMGQATIPIMLFTLGLSIPWGNLRPTPPVLAAVLVKLLLMPFLVLALARVTVGELREAQYAAVIESAMPTMIMAASFADRFHLDVRAAALTASWTSLGFLLTLPLWITLLK
ncbi:MAG: AEC family transporter [Betaproteobacteria bacterium]|nr:AEC family transporter [Betaproteobacteria bacterium]